MIKDMVGNYRILKEIGKGGMGSVYTALQLSLNRVVVIKEMTRTGGGREAQSRFKREGKICANLYHQNIVEIYDYIREEGRNFLVMEFVDGISLAEVIEKQAPLHPVIAATIAREIGRALVCAHQAGVVHRDIKPKNILITRAGVVKLTDFGVARDLDAPDLTTTGTLIGTPFYMSPEQAGGEKVGFQSDLYSLGIVLYEMVTGKKPYTGENSTAIIAKISRGKFKSAFWLAPHHSWRLARIVNRAMKNNPKRRFRAAEDMVHSLNRFLGWKGQATAENTLAALLTEVEQLKTAETEVKKPRPRKPVKKSPFSLYLLIFLIVVLVTFLIIIWRNR